MRKKILITLFAIICGANVYAQSTIEDVYKTILLKKLSEHAYFETFDHNSKILKYGGPISCVYDEKWNVKETHDAGSDSLVYKSNRTLTDGKLKETMISEYKYSYEILENSLSDFINGETNVLYYFQELKEVFLQSHSSFSSNYNSNTYITLVAEINVVDWDGNLKCKIKLPYYTEFVTCQALEVKNETYYIVRPTRIYPKDILKDFSLSSSSEYDLYDRAFESDYDHIYIYRYDNNTNSIELINTQKSKKSKTEIGRYDIYGTKLLSPQKGLNIILYSDGTSEKIIVN